jgi:thioredoxin reductase (NADPH)
MFNYYWDLCWLYSNHAALYKYETLFYIKEPEVNSTTTNEVEKLSRLSRWSYWGCEMMIEFQNRLKKQMFVDGWITKVDFSGDVHKSLGDVKEIYCETVIISTGAQQIFRFRI